MAQQTTVTVRQVSTLQIKKKLRHRLYKVARRCHRSEAGTAHRGWFTHRRKTPDEFDEHFRLNAAEFGAYMLENWPGDAVLRDSLNKLTQINQEPFLHLQSLFLPPRREGPRDVFPRRSALAEVPEDHWYAEEHKIVHKELERFPRKWRLNILASGLIAATGNKLRPKLMDSQVYRDYLTKPDDSTCSVTQFRDGWDLPRRYRTVAPELPLEPNGRTDAAPRVLVFACIENPMLDPIYLIRASDLIDLLQEKRETLMEESYTFFDNWNPVTLARNISNPKSIIYRFPSDTDPGMTFDPNRLDSAALEEHADERHAIVQLLKKTSHLSQHGPFYKVTLQRGDVLVIDNYRVLVSGSDHGRRRRLWGLPVRWLRAFYGFPPEGDAKPDD